MYKVFIQNNSISFIENSKNIKIEGFEISDTSAIARKPILLGQLNDPENNLHFSVLCSNPLLTFQVFFEDYEKITAAGGVVQFSDFVLIINRHGIWDLPKGKVEGNESIEAAAIREIEEETGITHLTIEKKLIETYHTYSVYGPNTLKTTVWFSLRTDILQQGKPQLEEAITEIKWVKRTELSNYFSDSFENLKLVIARFIL